MKILISGIPGTGKTSIGDYLEKNHKFRHINLEGPIFQEFISDSNKLIEEWVDSKENIVITWGFPPRDSVTEIILRLKNNQFKFIWFDGNRKAARKAFKERGTVSEDLLNIQLENIENYDITGRLNPIVYDTFKSNGEFKKKSVISRDLMSI